MSENTVVVELNSASSDADYVFEPHIDTVSKKAMYGSEDYSFGLGDTVVIEVNKSSNVIIDLILATSGIPVTAIGTANRTRSVGQLFSSKNEGDETELIIPQIITGKSIDFIGVPGLFNESKNSLNQTILKGNVNTTPFYANIEYSYTAELFQTTLPLTHLHDDSYNVYVVFYITVR